MYIRACPRKASRRFVTANHDENSWNGTEFEKYEYAYRAFAVFSQIFYQSIPLVYSGQELPNRKRLKFFVKDTIGWNRRYEMAPFYQTLLKLRRSTPALAADSFYKRLLVPGNPQLFVYLREKAGKKVLVALNLSGKPAGFTIGEDAAIGNPVNVFTGMKQPISSKQTLRLEPWGYGVFNYDR